MSTFTSLLAEIGSGYTPWKIAARCASGVDVPTLSGLLVVGGVTTVEGDRVFLYGQADSRLNGVWIASVNAWVRAPDMASGRYLQLGTTIRVMEGTGAGLWVLTSPTTGDLVVGSTALVFGAPSNVPSRPFASVLDLAENYVQTFDGNGTTACVLGLGATSGFVPGATVETFIPPDTATDLIVADNLDPDGNREPFDATKGYYALATAVSENAVRFAGFVVEELDTTTPTIVSAQVMTDQLDRIVLNLSLPGQFPVSGGAVSLVGISLGGTMVTARTISSVYSGQGTTAITLQLSGALSLTDTPTVVIASTCTLAALNGPKVDAGSTSVSFVAPDYDWSAVTGVTWWLRGDNGIGVADGAAVPSWAGMNPPTAATATQGTGANQPTYDASDAMNLSPGVVFDGVNDRLSTPVLTTSSLFGAASASLGVVAAVKLDAVDSTTGDSYDNDTIIADAGYWGMFLTHEGGTYRLVCLIYTDAPAVVYATKSFGASLPPYAVLSMRLSGGLLYAGIDGVESAGVTCTGTLNAASDGLAARIGCNTSVTKFFDGTLFELVTLSNGAAQTDGIAALTSKYVP